MTDSERIDWLDRHLRRDGRLEIFTVASQHVSGADLRAVVDKAARLVEAERCSVCGRWPVEWAEETRVLCYCRIVRAGHPRSK